ncbi:hypothetical protein ABPG74_021597 [Tetrahymena malaccensis]
MPRRRKQVQGQQKSKSQDSFQEPQKNKQPAKQIRISRIQGDENKMPNEDLEETIFYDETSSQQVFNRDESKPVNQKSLPSMRLHAMNESSNLIKTPANQIPRITRNSLAKAKKISEKESGSIIDNEEINKESYQESNTDAQILRDQEQLKKMFSTDSNLIQLKESYDSELIDHQHFQYSKNKGISKYGNKRGRKKTNEKDHYLPLEDTELMDELYQILLDYEYNFQDKPQNSSLFQKQENNFDCQNIVKKEFEQSQQIDFEKQNKDQILGQRIQQGKLVPGNYFPDQSNFENKHYNLTNSSNILIKLESQNYLPQHPIYNQNINQIQSTVNQNIQNPSDLINIQSNKPFTKSTIEEGQSLQDSFNNQNLELPNKIKKSPIQNQIFNSVELQDHVLIFNKYQQNILHKTNQQSQESYDDFNQSIQQHNSQNTNFFDSQTQRQSINGQKNSPENSYIYNQGNIDQSFQKNSSQMIDEDAETISTPTIKILQQLEQQVQTQKSLMNKKSSEIKQSRSYKLAEDIKIIYVMSQKKNKINGYSSKYWGLVVRLNLIQRPHESLRDRYKRFIKYLNRDNIIDIIKWVRKNNKIDGYLNFIKFKNNFKMFSHVSYEDPFASKKQLFSGHRVQDVRKNKSVSLESQSQNESDEQSVKKEEKLEDEAGELNLENQIYGQKNFVTENQNQLFCNDLNLKETNNNFQKNSNLIQPLNANFQSNLLKKRLNNHKKDSSNKNEQIKNCHSPSTQQNSQMSIYSPEINLKYETLTAQHIDKEIINNNQSEQKQEKDNILENSNFKCNQSCLIDGERLYIIFSESESDEDLYKESYLKDTNQNSLKQEMNNISQLQNINESEVYENQNQILPSDIMGNASINFLESEIIKKEEEEQISGQENSFVNEQNLKDPLPQDQIIDQSQFYNQQSNYQIQTSNQKVYPSDMNESFNSRRHIQEIEQLNRCDYFNSENDSNSFQQLYNKMVSQNNELNIQSKDFHSMDIELDQSQILI